MEAVILVGIPTSGKSTFAKQLESEGWFVLSRDSLREQIFGKNYKQNRKDEEFITEMYDRLLESAISEKMSIVLDNTHCRDKYIRQAMNYFKGTKYHVFIKFFEIGFYHALYRNVIRYIKTGKWIPIHVIENMYNNYKKIDQDTYEMHII
jgi:predicted kinase